MPERSDQSSSLRVRSTTIPGLKVVHLPVPADNRGWFKENWQHAKLAALDPELGEFIPVQHNLSFNEAVGTTRGIHAEPWNKYVSVASGRVFGAWVDLREGRSFGTVFTATIDPDCAVFVPRGVGNSYQTLVADTAYTYLVDDHWSPDAEYTFLNLADETVSIEWPIPLASVQISAKDAAHPRLHAVTPMRPKRTLVLGAGGQLGRALRLALPQAEFATRSEFDVTDPGAWRSRHWKDYDTIVNATAYTAVDAAETPEGRRRAWAVNVSAVAEMARVATSNGIRLVHVSSDYVHDGLEESHDEQEGFSPLGVYGQTKAAADAVVSTVPRHLLIRTSWVIGSGVNFVDTMADLARRGVDPRVVDDQVGRLTFAPDLAAAIAHLLVSDAPSGVYDVSNDGEPMSWARIAQQVFELVGHDPARVSAIRTSEYVTGRSAAPRPPSSVLDLTKIRRSGFAPRDQLVALRDHLSV